jgi:hypothetical protein
MTPNLGGKDTLKFSGLLGLVNVSSTGEKFDQGDNLTMWAEAPFSTSSVLVLDPGVRWEPIDDIPVRLIVPFTKIRRSLYGWPSIPRPA